MTQRIAGPLERAFQALAARESLGESLAAEVFGAVMRGEATPSQVAGLLMGLRVKGETADEVAGAARALGVSVALDASGATRVLREAGVAFLFAPNFHPAMRHVAPVRKELGVTTLMNLLGPLANPAGVRRQVIGVADAPLGPLVANALCRLGVEHALVVYGRVGMDEISPVGETSVWEVRDGEVTHWTLDPSDYGLAGSDVQALRGAEPAANAARLERLLEDGDDADGRSAVLLNGAAAIYAAGLTTSYAEGVGRARAALESGAARAALERLRRASPSSGG